MNERPYALAGGLLLILVALYVLWGLLFSRPAAVTDGTGLRLVETPAEPDRERVPEFRRGFFENRPTYKEWREQRDAAFRNFATDQEEKIKVSTEVTTERRRLQQAMGGPAAKHYNEALVKIGERRYEEAISLFILALKAEPNNTVIRLLTFKRMAMVYKTLQYERRYLVAMSKYLELLEKLETDPDQQERVRGYRREVEARYNQMGAGEE